MLLGLLLLPDGRADGRTGSDLFTPQERGKMRHSLEDALGVLSSLNNDNLVITRCHDRLERFVKLYCVILAVDVEQDATRTQVDLGQNNLPFDIENISYLQDNSNDFTWLDTAWLTEPLSSGMPHMDLQFVNDI